MVDRSVRNLANLQANGSSSRALNLIAVWKANGNEEGYRTRPLFQNYTLNRSIIVKHKLRPHERELLPYGQPVATKVILPMDLDDLKAGARAFFVGERNYNDFLAEIRVQPGDPDDELLRLLDGVPSLDPFLLRERVLSAGFSPDRCYFELADADLRRMIDFARREVEPLVGVSFGSGGARMSEKTRKLAAKLLGDVSDIELAPLRNSMGMNKADFLEGMFCWKGFIYYKWLLSDLLPKIGPIINEVARLTPMGMLTSDETIYVRRSQARLTRAINAACDTVRETLRVYDDAYLELTHKGRPQSFRAFLMAAPSMFHELGERLGALQHIISFWRFRFPLDAENHISIEEMIDLLNDFEASVTFDTDLTHSAA